MRKMLFIILFIFSLVLFGCNDDSSLDEPTDDILHGNGPVVEEDKTEVEEIKEQFSVMFYFGDELLFETIVCKGSSITPPNVEYLHYERNINILGWSSDEYKNVQHDLEIHLLYEQFISFYIEGVLYCEVNIDELSASNMPITPENKDFTISWPSYEEIINNAQDGNCRVDAIYSVRLYYVEVYVDGVYMDRHMYSKHNQFTLENFYFGNYVEISEYELFSKDVIQIYLSTKYTKEFTITVMGMITLSHMIIQH